MRSIGLAAITAHFGLMLAVGPAAAAAAARLQGGEPSPAQAEALSAEAEATESVAQIMARDRRLPRGFERLHAREARRFPFERQENRESLAVASWPPGADALLPTPLDSERLPQTVGVSFLGIQGGMSGSDSPFIPPGSVGAAGPSQLLVAANGRIRVFDKAGNLGSLDTTTDNFFASVGGVSYRTSDPHVRYDRLSGRWFVVMVTLDNCPNLLLLAMSSGSTIVDTTSFSFWSFTPEASRLDSPSLGVDRSALYIGATVFLCGTREFSSVSAYLVRKAELSAGGTPPLFVWRNLHQAGILYPQGVDNDDPAATEGYFIGVGLEWGTLGLRRVTDPATNPTLSEQLTLTVPTTYYPVPFTQPQPGGGPALDALDDRLFGAAIHKNKLTGVSTLWTAHNILVDSNGVGGGGGDRKGSRWYEIGGLTATPSLLQAGTLFDSATSTPFGYWIPSVAMSGQGHAAIGASRASANATSGGYASIAVAGRLRDGAAGTLQSPTLAQASSSVYDIPWYPLVPELWGDYSQLVVDPNDDQTFWAFHEYAASTTSWGVRVIQLKAPPPATPSTATPDTVLPGQASLSVTIDATSVGGAEFFDPGPDSGGPGFAGRLTATVSGGVTVTSASFVSPTRVTLTISTVGASPGPQNVTITNPDGQSMTGAGILGVSCPALAISPGALPSGIVGSSYSLTFSQAGGAPPISWSASGSLPAGVTWSASTATLEGTPSEAGSFPLAITATDSAGCTGSRLGTLVVNLPDSFVPTALSVDAGANGVLEAGELSVVVAPSWRNDTGAAATVGGGASAFWGPGTPNPTYTIADATADYGSVGAGATASCSTGGDCYGLSLGTPTLRPLRHWDASFLETLSNGDAKSWALHVGESFDDVPRSSPFYRFVEILLHRGVSSGCSASSYCPSQPATREQMAVFALVAKEGEGYSPVACGASPLFGDVPATSPYCRFVEELARRGVVSGCGGGNYCPESPVLREQMAVFVLRTLDPALDPPACATPLYADVPAASPYCRWIEELTRRGVVSGCGGGNYCPTAPTTREQMAVFLSLSFGLTLYGP